MAGRSRELCLHRIKICRCVQATGFVFYVHDGWNSSIASRDLVAAIERIVYVSVESTRIIEGLPTELTLSSQGCEVFRHLRRSSIQIRKEQITNGR